MAESWGVDDISDLASVDEKNFQATDYHLKSHQGCWSVEKDMQMGGCCPESSDD